MSNQSGLPITHPIQDEARTLTGSRIDESLTDSPAEVLITPPPLAEA